jgi:hypothetical protein
MDSKTLTQTLQAAADAAEVATDAIRAAARSAIQAESLAEPYLFELTLAQAELARKLAALVKRATGGAK